MHNLPKQQVVVLNNYIMNFLQFAQAIYQLV